MILPVSVVTFVCNCFSSHLDCHHATTVCFSVSLPLSLWFLSPGCTLLSSQHLMATLQPLELFYSLSFLLCLSLSPSLSCLSSFLTSCLFFLLTVLFSPLLCLSPLSISPSFSVSVSHSLSLPHVFSETAWRDGCL